jgi:hypothetical protein
VSGCRTMVHNGTVGIARGTGVPSDGGVIVMGVSRGHHIALSRNGEAGASPSARGYVTLIGGFLKNGMQ